VARRLRVHRDTVYAWAIRYKEGGPQTVATRVADAARPGRPRQLAQRVEAALTSVMETKPCEQGHRAARWTIPCLRQYLREFRGLVVSASRRGAACVTSAIAGSAPAMSSLAARRTGARPGGLKRGVKERPRTVVVMLDGTFIPETSP
jgi:Homeodomain-like domain